MSEGSDTDYWFLRKNGIPAKTTLKMLALAYKTVEQVKDKQTKEEWLKENTGIGEEL